MIQPGRYWTIDSTQRYAALRAVVHAAAPDRPDAVRTEPTKNLARASWLRKILSYSAASAKPTPVYQSYLKVPNLLVLCVFSDTTRMSHVMSVAKAHATHPSQFCFKAMAPVDPLLNAATIHHLASEPWERIGGGTFNLLTTEGR
jgi:hypothetical protein